MTRSVPKLVSVVHAGRRSAQLRGPANFALRIYFLKKFLEQPARHLARPFFFIMAKRKAEGLSDSLSVNGSKKVKHNDLSKAKKPSLLEDSDSSDSESGGAELNPEFNINEEYARRFEHNKKREELHRCKSNIKIRIKNNLLY